MVKISYVHLQHISTKMLYFQHLKEKVVLSPNHIVFNQKNLASALKCKTEMK